MKLDTTTRFELKAEAYRIMTGHMAPGKDASPQSYQAPYDERIEAFDRWSAIHGECVRAMLLAFERMMPDDDA